MHDTVEIILACLFRYKLYQCTNTGKIDFKCIRMQHLGQNKEDLCYPVYLFRFALKGKSAVFIFLMTKSNMA
jgi:hypothetical protein